MIRAIFALFIIGLCIVSCGPSLTPEGIVEKYIQAINEKDTSQLGTLTCKEWESDAIMMLDAFQAVATELEGLSCEATETPSDELAVVSCTGKIIASYDGELQEFDLSIQDYLVENSNGEWLVCGMQ